MQGVRGSAAWRADAKSGPRSVPKWQLVWDVLATDSVTRGPTACRGGMTRDRDVDRSQNPNWQTPQLDRWTLRSQAVSQQRRQKRWTRQQLVGRDIDTCWTKAG